MRNTRTHAHTHTHLCICASITITVAQSLGCTIMLTHTALEKAPYLPDPVTGPDSCDTHHSPAGTDLRIDWADACSLGRHGERYFLLVVDKGTEYLANFNSKTRQNPVTCSEPISPPLVRLSDTSG